MDAFLLRLCFRVFDSKAFFGILSWIKGTVCAKHRNGDGEPSQSRLTPCQIPPFVAARHLFLSLSPAVTFLPGAGRICPGRGKSFLSGGAFWNLPVSANKAPPSGELAATIGSRLRGLPPQAAIVPQGTHHLSAGQHHFPQGTSCHAKNACRSRRFCVVHHF